MDQHSYSRWNHHTRWTHACLTWVRKWLSSKDRRWVFFLSDPECGAEQNVLFVTFCRPVPEMTVCPREPITLPRRCPWSTVSRCARPPWVDLKCSLSRERLRQEKTDQLSRVKVGQNYHQVTSETGACCVVTDEFGLRDTSELEVNDRQSLGGLHLSHWYRDSHGGLQCVCVRVYWYCCTCGDNSLDCAVAAGSVSERVWVRIRIRLRLELGLGILLGLHL